mmetsp:Transcript_3475/g.9897  ORF Transcript_3475/g.9897 Transcript_3475/m.9897 type:complete len:347 (-) Transcript_3475:26-1066(-)
MLILLWLALLMIMVAVISLRLLLPSRRLLLLRLLRLLLSPTRLLPMLHVILLLIITTVSLRMRLLLLFLALFVRGISVVTIGWTISCIARRRRIRYTDTGLLCICPASSSSRSLILRFTARIFIGPCSTALGLLLQLSQKHLLALLLAQARHGHRRIEVGRRRRRRGCGTGWSLRRQSAAGTASRCASRAGLIHIYCPLLAQGRWRRRNLPVLLSLITSTGAGALLLQMRPRGSRPNLGPRRWGRGWHPDGASSRTTRGRRRRFGSIAAALLLCTAGRTRCCIGTARWRRRRRRRWRSMGGARCAWCRGMRRRGRGNSGAAAAGETPHGGNRQEQRRGSPLDQHLQ